MRGDRRWTPERIAQAWQQQGAEDTPELTQRAEALATEMRRMGWRERYHQQKRNQNEVCNGADPHDERPLLEARHRLHREPWHIERRERCRQNRQEPP